MTVLASLKIDTVKEQLSIASVTSGSAAAVMKGVTIHRPQVFGGSGEVQ